MMNFGQAIDALKAGHKVARAGASTRHVENELPVAVPLNDRFSVGTAVRA